MKQTLRNLIAEGKTKQTIAQLRQLTKNDADLNAEVVQLSARFSHYERQQRMGVEDPSVLGIELNKINNALLSVIDRLDEGTTSERVTSSHPFTTAKKEVINNPTDADTPSVFSTFNSMKNILYVVSTGLTLAAVYYIFEWYKAEPQNKEPLPALLLGIAGLVAIVITWQYEGTASSASGGFFRSNRAVIKGNKNTVRQGQKGNSSTIETNNAQIDGDENDFQQG
jgi:Effector-associated domain 11